MERQDSLAHRGSGAPQSPHHTQTWHFMVINNPHTARSAPSRRTVRSHAMRNYHQRTRDAVARGTRPIRPQEFELDVDKLLERSVHRPIQEANREIELYGHLLDRTCIMFRTMQDIGFLDHVRQTAAFRQLLAMSSWHLTHLHQHRAVNEHLQFSLTATQDLQRQINDPLTCTSDEALGAVLVFVCSANLLHDHTGFNAHMHGLRRIVDLRGGLRTLNINPVLRIMVFWADVNGAYFQDEAPIFPPPLQLLPASQQGILRSFSGENNTSTSDQITHICEAFRNVQALLHVEMHSRNVWQDSTFQGFYLIPILGQVLAMRHHDSDETDRSSPTLELLRLAAVLYISALRAPFGVDTLSTELLYASKIQNILTSLSSVDDIPPALLAWVLSVGFTSDCDTDMKRYFENALVVLMKLLHVTDAEKWIEIITAFCWDEKLLVSQSILLRTIFASRDWGTDEPDS